MTKVSTFIKKNKWITIFFMISLSIILSYILTMDQPEWFDGAEEWYDLFFQLSIGYIINFIFYITQVYVPNNRRDTAIKKCIAKRIEQLIKDMDASLAQLAHVYANGHSGDTYTAEELDALLKLRFTDTIHVIHASKLTTDGFVHFTVREWIRKCIEDTEKDIDDLYKYYAADISVDLMGSLEAILRSKYHSTMKMLLVPKGNVDFSATNDNFFVEYYDLIQQLKHVSAKDYT